VARGQWRNDKLRVRVGAVYRAVSFAFIIKAFSPSLGIRVASLKSARFASGFPCEQARLQQDPAPSHSSSDGTTPHGDITRPVLDRMPPRRSMDARDRTAQHGALPGDKAWSSAHHLDFVGLPETPRGHNGRVR